VRGSFGCIVFIAIVAGMPPASAWAEGSIYTCVDSKGRRITNDRPILDCIDREQQELGPTGKVVRKVGPSLTAEERAAEEEKQRKEQDERNRIADEKRRDRVLLARYPDRATHDKERVAAIASVDDVIGSANRRTSELMWQRKKLDQELEFYKGDFEKAPLHLKRRFDEIDQSLAVQRRFIANQEEEKKRINERYDEELARLKTLWATIGGTNPGTATAKPATAKSSAAAPAPVTKK